jgi:hypothetical protein
MTRMTVFCRSILILGSFFFLVGNALSQTLPCDLLCSKQKEVKQLQENDANPALDGEVRRINSLRLHDSLIELRILVQQNLTVASGLLASASGDDATVLKQKIATFAGLLQEISNALDKESHQIPSVPPSRVSPAAPKQITNPASASPAGGQVSTAPGSAGTPPVLFSTPASTTSASCSTSAPTGTLLSLLAHGAAELVASRADPAAANGQLDSILFAGFADLTVPSEVRESQNQILQKLYVKAETRRSIDKQLAAPAGGSGSTTAIDKPDFTRLLGFAIEHGGVTQAINGTSLTLSSSPYSLLTMGSGGDTAENYRRYGALTRLGAAASFNIQDQNNALASVTRKQLSGWTVRYRFSPDRSTRSRDFLDYWNKNVLPNLDESGKALAGALLDIQDRNAQVVNAILLRMTDPTSGYIAQYYSQHKNDAHETLVSGLEHEISCRVTELYKANISKLDLSEDVQSDLQNDFNAYVQAQSKIQRAIEAAEAFSQELEKRWQGSISYVQNRQDANSNFSTFKLIFEKSVPAPLKFTTNAVADVYHKPDPLKNQDTLRSFSVAGSLEYVLGRSPFLTNAVDQSPVSLALTGSYQRMPENRHKTGLKADIGVAQLKIQFPVSAGVTLPFSVSYANSSELIKETHVKANFGLSFDLDKLTHLLSASTTSQTK